MGCPTSLRLLSPSEPLPKTLSTHQLQQPEEVFSQAPEASARLLFYICLSTLGRVLADLAASSTDASGAAPRKKSVCAHIYIYTILSALR